LLRFFDRTPTHSSTMLLRTVACRSWARSCLYRSHTTVASRSEPPASSEEVASAVNDLSKPAHVQAPKRKPFMKSMFLGTVDTELLTFPESLNRDEQARLNRHREELERALQAPAGPDSIRLAGLQGPLAYGGKQFTETEFAYVQELVAGERTVAMGALEHNAIVKLLAQHGTPEAQEQYLAKLCAGETVAAAGLYELSSSRDTMFSTVASLDFTGGRWTLSGSKVFLRTGPADPDLLLVVASTKRMEKLNKEDGTIAAFLVDARAPGVKIAEAPLGTGGLARVTVHLNRVEVPESALVGTENEGGTVLSKFLSAVRVQSSVVRVALLKKVLNGLTEFAIHSKAATGDMMDLELVREQLARMASVIYAAESLIYTTASLMDDYEGQDVEMEAAITKVFTTGSLLSLATLPLQLLGPQALSGERPFQALFDDALKLFIGDESIDSDRNPAMNPSHVLSRLFDKTSIEHPKKFADLQQYFHPSLEPAAHWIEQSVVRLRLATECVLSRHGVEVIERHLELGRLATIATQLYAMVACASRASRSYCIGLRHAAQDVHLANMFCREGSERVRLLALELEKGPYITRDDDYT
uniref:Acyl-CoA dehydrogenase family member 9 n=1 Tax=Anopheles coluzzii TaxID=1518534 RepID=A0A8W7PIH6_ANOCL